MQLINEMYKGVLVYLDDIPNYSEMMEKLVRQVLRKLLDAKLHDKLSKCKLHKISLDYLENTR